MKKTLRKVPSKLLAGAMCLAIPFAGIAAIGSTSANAAADYTPDYNGEQTLAMANQMNVDICDEGFVLLKNGNVTVGQKTEKALPVIASVRGMWSSTPTRISVFGRNTTTAKNAYGGGGSSSGGAYINSVGIYEGLTKEGYALNPSLRNFYEAGDKSQNDPNYNAELAALAGPGREVKTSVGKMSNYRTGEVPVENYEKAGVTYDNYKKMAVVMISRCSGEGGDAPLHSAANTGRTDLTEHYLELDQNEKDLFKMVKGLGFERVVAVINAGSMELGFIDEEEYGIDAAIWIGSGPGRTGMESLGRILSGTVNPSGRTADTFYRDFTKDPTYFDYGTNSHGRAVAGLDYASDTLYNEAGVEQTGDRYINYQEGIYMGYRYYETRGYEEQQKVLKANANATTAQQFAWYDNAMVYPFGYGLSYTSFEWTLANAAPANNATLTADGTIKIDVKVKNTGSVAGKDVVQLYYSAPYTAGGIEKSHVVLGGYAKTKLLKAGEEQTVTISLKVRDMASYDWNDANDNTFKGYEVEAGSYTIRLGKNANEAWRSSTLKVNYTVEGNGFQYPTNEAGREVKNRFDDVSEGVLGTQLSRADFEGTFPHFLTIAERTKSNDFIAKLGKDAVTINAAYDEGQPWYSATKPNQRETAMTGNEEDIILLSDLVDVPKDDPLWDKFMDQLTVAQLNSFVNTGMFNTAAVPELGVPATKVSDGPVGLTQSGGATGSYASTVVLAATYNDELAYAMGETIGHEALANGYNGIYAPGSNVHRSPFCGRNFEYYSEDGLLSGKMGAQAVLGMQSKGCMAYVKHYAFRNTEEEGSKTSLWLTEQAMREIYLKSFQLPAEEGKALGFMTCTNAVGAIPWGGYSYALMTEILRDEWGFEGCLITDWGTGLNNFKDESGMIRAGTDFILANGNTNLVNNSAYDPTTEATQITQMRRAAKNILFAVSRTNAMPAGYTAPSEVITTSNKFSLDVSSYSTRLDAERTYAIVGELPEGFTFNANSGVIKGDATKAESGKYTVTVNSFVNGYLFARNELSIIIPGINYETSTLAQGTVGTQYVGSVATGDSFYAGGLNYTLKDGTLPAGVTLDKNGTLIGTPTAAGTSTFTVVASAPGVEDKEATFTLTVAAVVEDTTVKDLQDKLTASDNTVKDLQGKLDELQKKVDELEANGSGCNGSVAATSVMAGLALTAIAAGAIVARRKKSK